MPLPGHEHGRGVFSSNSAGHSNKGVDFSSSLESIDPKYPQSPVGNHDGVWDTETDHILSYFLGGDTAGAHHDEADFASSGHPHSNSHDSNAPAGNDEDLEMMHLPPTPAVQFYPHATSSTHHHHHHHHNHHHHNNDTTSSSSSYGTNDGNKSKDASNSTKLSHSKDGSSSEGEHKSSEGDRNNPQRSSDSRRRSEEDSKDSGAGNLVAGGHMFQHHLYSNKTTSHDAALPNGLHNYGENPSPISPVAMIGLANENLMLPPPSRTGSEVGSSGTPTPAAHPTSEHTQQHAHPPSSSSLVGIFGSNRHENIILASKKKEESDQKPTVATDVTTTAHSQVMAPPPPMQMPVNNNMMMRYPNGVTSSTIPVQHAQPLHPGNPSALLPNHHPIHAQHMMYAHHAAAILNHHHGLLSATTVPQVESEEKRAKRLERNRESARKSRRKKKERLLTLGAQVNQLHKQIETERKKHINTMVPAMNMCRLKEIEQHLQDVAAGAVVHENLSDRTCVVIQQTGPNSRAMRSVLDFQFTQLKQLTLPSYQKMLLWFTLLEENYFIAGKEKYAKKIAAAGKSSSKPSSRSSSSASNVKNVSSKQIGDELFNGSKDEKGKGKKKKDKDNDGDRLNITSDAYDASHTWPLICFELRFSVDQEERFLAAHKQMRSSSLIKDMGENKNETLASHRSQMAAGVNTAESLNKAVGSLSHVISRREDQSLARILNPEQLLKYQTWLNSNTNREKCRNLVDEGLAQRGMLQSPPVQNDVCTPMDSEIEAGTVSASNSKEASLQDICRRLNEVLRISQK